MIGPPFELGLPSIGIPDDALERVIDRYRERYADTGAYENTLYDGMIEMLDALASAGYSLSVATAKPEVTAHPILDYFGISNRFEVRAGATLTSERRTKGQVIEHALHELGLHADADAWDHVIMIGDRDHDVLGAMQHHIPCIGVLWGYGSIEELLRRRGGRARRVARRSCRAGGPGIRLAAVMSQPQSPAVSDYTVTDPALLGPPRSSTDRFMRKLLRLPVDGPKASADQSPQGVPDVDRGRHRPVPADVHRVPVRAAAGRHRQGSRARGSGWSSASLAIVCITMSIRRFWRADHSKRWHYTVFGTVVIGFLLVLVVQDLTEIVS